MRKFLSVAILAMGVGLFSLPGARAQDRNDPSTPPSGHVQQDQNAKPSEPQNLSKNRDQSALAPQPPGVIAPPATGDKSVITPPATGTAKTPVIPPPGTHGDNNDVEPK
ncbi:MAG TPA: hypothetical protein VKV32_19300 [Stellaceae bacterium]|nr:hypothetical protein [Stellaceae bacterium]